MGEADQMLRLDPIHLSPARQGGEPYAGVPRGREHPLGQGLPVGHYVSRGKVGEVHTGKRDYRPLWWFGERVDKFLLYLSGIKGKNT